MELYLPILFSRDKGYIFNLDQKFLMQTLHGRAYFASSVDIGIGYGDQFAHTVLSCTV